MLSRRDRKVWENLVAFANSNPPDPELLREAILWYLPWPVRCEGFLATEGEDGKPVRRGYVVQWLETQDFKEDIREHHFAVKQVLLRWLVERDAHPHRDGVYSYINTYIGNIKLAMKWALPIPKTYTPDFAIPFPRDMSPDDYQKFIEETEVWHGLRAGIRGSRKNAPMGGIVPSKEYWDVLAPIVDFIVGEFERVRQDGLPIPIFDCEYCGKFFVAAKIRQSIQNKFCSPSCKSLDQRKHAPAGKGTYDQWLRRALSKPPKGRRDYMSKQVNIDRLSVIEAYQEQLGPTCQRMVRQLRSFRPVVPSSNR